MTPAGWARRRCPRCGGLGRTRVPIPPPIHSSWEAQAPAADPPELRVREVSCTKCSGGGVILERANNKGVNVNDKTTPPDAANIGSYRVTGGGELQEVRFQGWARFLYVLPSQAFARLLADAVQRLRRLIDDLKIRVDACASTGRDLRRELSRVEGRVDDLAGYRRRAEHAESELQLRINLDEVGEAFRAPGFPSSPGGGRRSAGRVTEHRFLDRVSDRVVRKIQAEARASGGAYPLGPYLDEVGGGVLGVVERHVVRQVVEHLESAAREAIDLTSGGVHGQYLGAKVRRVTDIIRRRWLD